MKKLIITTLLATSMILAGDKPKFKKPSQKEINQLVIDNEYQKSELAQILTDHEDVMHEMIIKIMQLERRISQLEGIKAADPLPQRSESVKDAYGREANK